jgi:outer membrane protein assembly factor BamD (BamD/ComL family)
VLYTRAEAAMQRGDLIAARAAFDRLVRAAPDGRLADPARYELARLAVRTGDQALAARTLDELIASGRDPSLREPARFLRCRVELDAGRRRAAIECLKRFLHDFPASPHAATAQHLLGGLTP